MSLTVRCIACGNQKQAPLESAGQFMNCDICSSIIRIPALSDEKDPFTRVSSFPPTIIQRLCLSFGLLSALACFTGAGIILFAGAAQTNEVASAQTVYFDGGKLMGLAAAYALLGFIYLCSGVNIRRNGAASSQVVLVVGGIHGLLLGANFVLLSNMQRAAIVTQTALKNAVFFEAISLALLGVFLACALLALLAHHSPLRARAGRFFSLLSVYGILAFVAIFAVQGLIILGHPIRGVQIPEFIQNNQGRVYGFWLAGAMLLWLEGISVSRSLYFGPIAGFLTAVGLEVVAIWFARDNLVPLMAHHDSQNNLIMGGAAFALILLACPAGLLVRSLFKARRLPTPPASSLPASERLIFDMYPTSRPS